MIHFSELSDRQRRFIYLSLATAISIAGIFSVFPRSHADPAMSKPPAILLSPTPIAEPARMLVIDVAGKVLHPGVYRLPENSRAIDAIKKAGGALKGVSTTDINLAHILMDGEQIIVGAPPIVTTASKARLKSSGGKSSTAIVNINSATAAQLQVLPGIGPVMAAKIVSYRTSHGRFAASAEIASVPGFGKKRFEAIAKQLRI